MLLKSKIIGEGSDVLVVLHGFLGMSDNWNSFAKKIDNQGFQIHLLDQRNHGNSFHSKEFNYKLLSNDLKYYIDYHQIKNFSLIGHSRQMTFLVSLRSIGFCSNSDCRIGKERGQSALSFTAAINSSVMSKDRLN